MCRTRPTTCALRDDHPGIHMTPHNLNTTVTQYTQVLLREIETELDFTHNDLDREAS